ncbi:MAG: helix-turn-helix domain-containing protein [Acinetobacter sp.]|nr:MAG: helix-turn-helix domain-containing protein [Acinetobacter sp.]
MKYRFIDKGNGAELSFFLKENIISKGFTAKKQKSEFTIALNTGPAQKVLIDGKWYSFSTASFLPLFGNQAFDFQNATEIIAWQYNGEFNDGLVIEGLNNGMFASEVENKTLSIDPLNQKKINSLTTMFIDEFSAGVPPEREMLEILLRQLIVIVCRLAKNQYLDGQQCIHERLELIKKYNIMVEKYYKQEHQVQFYAEKLNRSPKTLSNLFLLYRYRSPILVIHERIIKEAKKLFYYTEMSAKEIAYELGFQEQAHFSRFFKNYTSDTPRNFKKRHLRS